MENRERQVHHVISPAARLSEARHMLAAGIRQLSSTSQAPNLRNDSLTSSRTTGCFAPRRCPVDLLRRPAAGVLAKVWM